MAQYAFGSGSLWGTATAAAVNTPSEFGALQDIQMDFAATIKELYGTFQFPLTVARGTVKVTGKAKMGQLQGRLFNDLFFNGTSAGGQLNTVNNEAATIPATPFQITVANSATWTTDLGVVATATGTRMTRVASAPTTGQYTATAGVYLFATADTGKAVFIDYMFTVPTTGQTITVVNTLLGVAPTFKPVMSMSYVNPTGATQQMVLSMNAATSNKLSLASKLEDFLMPELDFSCYCDSANVLMSVSLAETN